MGNVGATIAYTLMLDGTIPEIVLIDINEKKAEGEAMDLNHGMSFVKPAVISSGDYPLMEGSDIVIIAAGVSQKPGETRISLLQRNTQIFKGIVEKIKTYSPDAILLVVTNPVDILTYITYKLSGFPKNRVIGSGTVLDTSRFRYMISRKTGIDPRNVHGYIIGEHGDSEVAAWSLVNIAGVSMDIFCKKCKLCDNSCECRDIIFEKVKHAAYEIIERKGSTYYAVGLAVKRIVEAIVRNENSILTVSVFPEGHYGIDGISLSLPAVVGNKGVNEIIEIPVSESELEGLRNSAAQLKEALSQIDLL